MRSDCECIAQQFTSLSHGGQLLVTRPCLSSRSFSSSAARCIPGEAGLRRRHGRLAWVRLHRLWRQRRVDAQLAGAEGVRDGSPST